MQPFYLILAAWLRLKRFVYRFKCNQRIKNRRTGKKKTAALPFPVIGFSHLRCATVSTGKILEAIGDLKNLNCFWGYQPITPQSLQELTLDYDVLFFHEIRRSEFPDQFKGIDFRGFHFTRDPRNLLVSQYFSYGFTHKIKPTTEGKIVPDRTFLQAHNTEEGLLYLMRQSKNFLMTMGTFEQWDYEDPRLLEIRFEDYVKDPIAYWRKILNFTKIDVPEDHLQRILSIYSFKNLQKMSPQSQGMNHYRSAKPDDHEQHFTPKVKDEFKKLYGDLLIRLGYVKNNAW